MSEVSFVVRRKGKNLEFDVKGKSEELIILFYSLMTGNEHVKELLITTVKLYEKNNKKEVKKKTTTDKETASKKGARRTGKKIIRK